VLSINISQLSKTVVMAAASGCSITVLTPVCCVWVACKSSEVDVSMELWSATVTSGTETLTSVVCCCSDWCTEKCEGSRFWQHLMTGRVGDDPCLRQKAPNGLLAAVRTLTGKPRDLLPKISKTFRVLTAICLDYG
jgi:hypothetical protein